MDSSIKRIIIIAVGAAVVLVCIIFSIPFNTVSYPEVETYQYTDFQQEPYETTERYVSVEMVEKEETIFDDTPYSVPLGISVPFSITSADARLVGRFELPAPGGFYIYSAGN